MPCAAHLQHRFSPAWHSATPQGSKEREAYLAGARTQATCTCATPIFQVYTMIFGQRRIESRLGPRADCQTPMATTLRSSSAASTAGHAFGWAKSLRPKSPCPTVFDAISSIRSKLFFAASRTPSSSSICGCRSRRARYSFSRVLSAI